MKTGINRAAVTIIALVLLMSILLLPTSVSKAQQEQVFTPSGTTEYPWTYRWGHCTDKGAYQAWSYSPGPGPLTNHILWMVPGAGSPAFCFDGKVWAGSYCLDAATGDVIWYNPAASVSGTAGWIPKDIQPVEGYETFGYGPEVRVGQETKDKSDGYTYTCGSKRTEAPGVPGEFGYHFVQKISLKTGDVVATSPTVLGGRYGKPALYYSNFADYTFQSSAKNFLRIYVTGNSPAFLECWTTGLGTTYGTPGISKLWDTWTVSNIYEETEYPILPDLGATWKTAENAAFYEEGTVEYFERYWARHSGTGCLIPTTGENGIMYNVNGHAMIYYNETLGNWVEWDAWTDTGGAMLPWNAPDGMSKGVPELLNINGGTLVECDWDYTDFDGPRDRDSMGMLNAYNMTDGTILWRRVGALGCYEFTVDSEKNLVWIAQGSHIKCYDATTGEKKWWFLNPTFAEAGQHTAYDGENVYHTFWDGTTYALNAETGEVVWGPVNVEGFYACSGVPLVSGESDAVYLSLKAIRGWKSQETDPGKVIALDRNTGEVIWELDGWRDGGWFTGTSAVLADGRLYVREGYSNNLFCFGAGPTKTTLELSTSQFKVGDTVLISGQVLDQSPASPDAPVANEPVTIFYVPLDEAEIKDIATVTTGYAGDYYTEWTVPDNIEGKFSVVASFAGSDSYELSAGQVNIMIGPAAAVSDYTPMLYAVIGLTVVAIVISVYSVFIKKPK